jgi:tetratricopeptide (TPR) repeat protein
MKGLRNILLIFALQLFCTIGKAQNTIDSLKKALPTLKDSARIDCLNELSSEYVQNENKDSASYFAESAIRESKKINYIHGIAVAFSRKVEIAKHFDDDFVQSEKLGKESLHWYVKTGNKEGIENALSLLFDALTAQSKFEEAIAFINMSYAIAKERNDKNQMSEALKLQFVYYQQTGLYEKALASLQQLYEMSIKEGNKIWLANSWWGLGVLYRTIGDFPTSLSYLRQVYHQYQTDQAYREELVKGNIDIWLKMEFAESFSLLQQFDSAWYYYNLFKPSKAAYLRIYWISTGECFFLQKQYDAALQNFLLGLAEHKKLNDRNEMMRSLLDIGNTYLALGNIKYAKKFGQEGLHLALQTKAKQFIRDGYQILSTVFDRLHKKDSANFYFREYINMKDTVLNDQTKGKLAAYAYEQKIAIINSEKEIQKAKLEKASLLKKVLFAGILFLFLFGIIIVRNIRLSRKNEKQDFEHRLVLKESEGERLKAKFQQEVTELEMQALRAQMNPHFIFNCLNAINHFILSNETETASDYLTKFSRLIRTVLHLSQKAEVSLQEELDYLNLYIQLEQLRFQKHFQYTIQCDDIDTESIKIPPMLLQPFVENAIWHGLMHKERDGLLNITLAVQDSLLYCTISDNGIGREEAAAIKSKSAAHKNSLGMQITASRLQLLNNGKNDTFHFKVIDLKYADGTSAGTKVILTIPVTVFQNPIPDPSV